MKTGSRNLFGLVTVIAACLTLSGCGTTNLGPMAGGFSCGGLGTVDDSQVVRAVSMQSACCSSITELPFVAMEQRPPLSDHFHSPVYYEVDLSTPVFEFPEGKSPFLAFDLGAPGANSVLHYRSRMSGMTGCGENPPRGQRLFEPIVTFLDEKKTVLVSGAVAKSTKFTSNTISFTFSFPIPRAAKYVVIHTRPERFGQVVMSAKDGSTLLPVAPGVFIPMGGGTVRFVSTATAWAYVWTEK